MFNNLIQVLLLLVNTIGSLYVSICLLRLILPIVNASFLNPLSQLIFKATEPGIKPLRIFLPSFGTFSLAALIWALLIQLLILVILFSIQGMALSNISIALYLGIAFIKLLNSLLDLYFFGLIVIIIASFIAPYSSHPALQLVRSFIEPVLTPIRKLLPPMGGLDFSPMVLMLAIIVLRTLFQIQ